MAYVPQSVSQEEWDELKRNVRAPRLVSEEEKAEFARQGERMMATFVDNLNRTALESEDWRAANDKTTD